MKDYFVYVDEVNENIYYPSQDSDGNVDLKQTLLLKYIKEGENLDGHLVENIFEYPVMSNAYLIKFEKEKKN